MLEFNPRTVPHVQSLSLHRSERGQLKWIFQSLPLSIYFSSLSERFSQSFIFHSAFKGKRENSNCKQEEGNHFCSWSRQGNDFPCCSPPLNYSLKSVWNPTWWDFCHRLLKEPVSWESCAELDWAVAACQASLPLLWSTSLVSPSPFAAPLSRIRYFLGI